MGSASVYEYIGKMNELTVEDLNASTELYKYVFSEKDGLIVNNLAANRPTRSDMVWVLGGSSAGTQWSTSEFQRPKDLIEGWNKTAKPAVTAITLDPSQYYTIYFKAYQLTHGNAQYVFDFSLFRRNYCYYVGGAIVYSGGQTSIKYNGGNAEGVTEQIAAFYDSNGGSANIMGRFSGSNAWQNPVIACIVFKGNLSEATVRSRLASEDFTDATIIHYNNQGTLVEDNEFIPADPNNSGFDIHGFPLGIPQDEDIGYEEITDDISRFYDTDGNLVDDMLVYSDDYLAEPIAGSMGNFDKVLYGDLGAHNEYKVQNFEVKFRVFVRATDANYRYFVNRYNTNGSGTIGGRGGFLIIHRSGAYWELITTYDASNLENWVTTAPAVDNNWYEVSFKKYGTTCDWSINDISGTINGTNSNINYPIADVKSFIGVISDANNLPSVFNVPDCLFNYLEFYELNVSGDRINELINLQFSETKGLVVHRYSVGIITKQGLPPQPEIWYD
jgi:hypothetical protein